MKSARSSAFFCLAVLRLVMAVISPACSKSDPSGVNPASTASAPVPSPEGLVAEVTVVNPEVFWGKARGLAGGVVGLLPQSFGVVVTTVLELPVTVAGEIDGRVPALGAIVDAGEGTAPKGAIGIHVREGERFVSQLVKGEGARFAARTDPATTIVVLDAKTGGKPPASLGVLGNYLLVAPRDADLFAIGPHIVRNMSRSPAPEHDVSVDVPASGMRGPVRARLVKMEAALRESAKGNPAVESVVGSLLDSIGVVSDVRSARVTVDLDPASVRVRASITPNEAGPAQQALAQLATGDLAPMLAAQPPGNAGVALLRESATSRGESAERQTNLVLGASGGDVPAADRAALVAALTRVAEARGEWLVAGICIGGNGPTIYFRSPVIDQNKVASGMRDAVSFVKRPWLIRALRESGLAVTMAKRPLPGLAAEVAGLHFVPVAKAPKSDQDGPRPAAVDVLYAVEGGELLLAIGADPADTLRFLARAPDADSAGGIPLIGKIPEELGANVAFAAAVDPSRVLLARGGPAPPGPSPILVAAGRGPSSDGPTRPLWIHLDIANPAVRELLDYRSLL